MIKIKVVKMGKEQSNRPTTKHKCSKGMVEQTY